MKEIITISLIFLSGIIAGMGMGGGTLLIPVLSLVMMLPQPTAQAINLVAFLPCAVLSICIHIKNKFVNYKVALPIILSGAPFAYFLALLAQNVQPQKLKVYFGIFLICVGLYQLALSIIKYIKNKKAKKNLFINVYKVKIYNSKYILK